MRHYINDPWARIDNNVAERAKIASKYPEKAREIMTGSLNTLSPGQHVFIESTAEGRDGYFYELCKAESSPIGIQ